MRLLAPLVAATFLLLVALVAAECPNGCTGNGDCQAKDMCNCYKNYQGNDCADRTCVFSRAHVDTPRGDLNMDQSRSTPNWILTNSQQSPLGTYEYFNPSAANDEAHFYLECSNKGICDRTTGICTCFDGYEGNACQRTTCPNKCSGHGTCESIRELGVKAGGTLFLPIEPAGASVYDLWDGNTTYGCRCDPWFTGPDCSKRKCKVGVDPLYLSNGVPIYETFVVQAYTTLTVFPTSDVSTVRIRMFDYHGESYITAPITILDDTDAVGAAAVIATTMTAAVHTANMVANALANSVAVQKAIRNLPNLAFRGAICEPMNAGPNLAGFYSVRTTSLGLSVVCQLKNPGKIRLPEVKYYNFPGATSAQQNAFVVTTTQQGRDTEWLTTQSAYVVSLLTADVTAAVTALGVTWVLTTGVASSTPTFVRLGPHIVLATTTTTTSMTLAYGLSQTLGTADAIMFMTTSPSTVLATVISTTLTVAPAVSDNTLTFSTTAPTTAAGATPASHVIVDGDLIFYQNQFFYVMQVNVVSTKYVLTLDKRFGGNSFSGGAGATGDAVYLVTLPTDKSGFFKYVNECSGRGMCATDSGICACFKGYTNDNCNTQNILAL